MTALVLKSLLTRLFKTECPCLGGGYSFSEVNMAITYRGERFSGYNKPKRTSGHATKSHAVLAKEGDKIKLIRFGQQGADNKPPRKNESAADKAKRASFKARHAKNIAKGIMSGAYWSDRVKW
jgi:hypothetical protein